MQFFLYNNYIIEDCTLTSVCRCRWSRSKGDRMAQLQRSQMSPWMYTHWSA